MPTTFQTDAEPRASAGSPSAGATARKQAGAAVVLVLGVALGLPFGSARAQDAGAEDIVRQLTPKPALTRSLAPAVSRRIVITPDDPDKVLAETESKPSVSIRVLFKYGSDVLTPDGEGVLKPLAQALADPRLGGSRFLVGGHTDDRGSDEYNQSLSERRARAVKEHLVLQYHIGPERLETMGFGKRKPADPARPDDPVNRRVEVVNLGQ